MLVVENPTKYPKSAVVVRFQDCDPFGHLNNARYLDYFINAREDHLARCYGLDIYERQRRTHENWVVASHRIAYLLPVRFREEVVIQTCLVTYTKNSLWMEGAMLSQDESHLKAVLWTRFRYFSFKTGKAAEHSPELMDFWGRIAVAGQEMVQQGFEARVDAMRALFSGGSSSGEMEFQDPA